MSVRESSVTGDEALLLRTVNAARFAREGWAEVYSPPASDCKCQVCSVLTSAWAPRSESATLDPQNGGLEVISAQGVISCGHYVRRRALCSACGMACGPQMVPGRVVRTERLTLKRQYLSDRREHGRSLAKVA